MIEDAREHGMAPVRRIVEIPGSSPTAATWRTS
jgi:hypothetical protein